MNEKERGKKKERWMFTWGHCSVLLFLLLLQLHQTTNNEQQKKSKDAEQQLVSVQLSSVLFCCCQNVCCFLPSALASVLLLFRCSVVASTHLSFNCRVCWALSAFCHTDRLLTTSATTKLFFAIFGVSVCSSRVRF